MHACLRLRFGIELEPNQVKSIMKESNIDDSGDASKQCLLENYSSLNHKFMDYNGFLDNLDTHNVLLHTDKAANKGESHLLKDGTKTFDKETGRAVFHPSVHQGRRVSKKLLAHTSHMSRDSVETVLSSFDGSKVGELKPEELRSGLTTLGLTVSDKEFEVLTTEVLRKTPSGNFSLTDVLPAADVFTSVCEADDFSALEKKEKGGANLNLRTSAVLYPEMPQAKIFTKRERDLRVKNAKLSELISKNDVAVKKAWEGSGKVVSGANLKKVLSGAGLQVSDADALCLSQQLAVKGNTDQLEFSEICEKLNVQCNIKDVRVDARTDGGFLNAGMKMKSSAGVVREGEEAPGGIFARSTHRGTHGWGRKGFENTISTAEDLYHGDFFEKRRNDDGHCRVSQGNRKKRVESTHGDRETVGVDKHEDLGIMPGNRKRMSPTMGDVGSAKDHMGVGMKVMEMDGGRISPDLVGNKKGMTVHSREGHLGSVGNFEVERTDYVAGESKRMGESILFPKNSKGDATAHGNPMSHSKDTVTMSPNKRRPPPKDFAASANNMRAFLVDSSTGTMMGAKEVSQRAAVQTPAKGAEREEVPAPNTHRSLRRQSYSAASLPSFGACGAPYASVDAGANEASHTVRPYADTSKVMQSYFSNAQVARTPAPFAVDGDKPAAPKNSKRFALSARKWGLEERRGFNIISNMHNGEY